MDDVIFIADDYDGVIYEFDRAGNFIRELCQKKSFKKPEGIKAWNEKLLERALKAYVVELIWTRAKETKKPIYFIIDDTISEKTKPSSKAINPIEKCSFHNSHLKGKNVYGHQILVSLLSCDGLVLPYSIDIYDKESMSKIKLTQNLISLTIIKLF